MTTTTVSPVMKLNEIAHARSGDKGNHANIGVIAFTNEGFTFLQQLLTETRMAEYFLPLRPREIQRYELPGIMALNFVLKGVLAGGASESFRTDNQGKVLGPALLEMEFRRPANWEKLIFPKLPEVD